MTAPFTGWIAFFGTIAGVAASLTGLVMVALSVNIRQIIEMSHLPARAASTIGALVLILLLALCAELPQPLASFAIEADVAAALVWVFQLASIRQTLIAHRRLSRPMRERLFQAISGYGQAVPLTLGAVLLNIGHPTGLYWLAFAMLACLTIAVMNAWILLVEILR